MQKFLDRFAVSISGLCAIHCLLTPVALTAFPLLGLFMTNSYIHLILYIIVLPTSTIALFLGCRKHKDETVFALGAAGIIILTLAATALTDVTFSMITIIDQALTKYEHIFTVAGGICLIAAHVRNFYLCRHDHCEH